MATTTNKQAQQPDPEPMATSKETVLALLKRSHRVSTPIRKSFLQSKQGRSISAGPLAQFVKNGDERALDLYLLTVTMASSEPWTVTESAELWARALGHIGRGVTSASLSRLWSRLEQRKLLERTRDGRRVMVTLRTEDGSGSPYSHPGKPPVTPYLKLPHEYWSQDWCQTLGLPAKAMLLIALSLRPGFIMPVEKVPLWYGFSADTAQRGLSELGDCNLIVFDSTRKSAPLAPAGFTMERRYTLNKPFASSEGSV